jgi:hypothetical protein
MMDAVGAELILADLTARRLQLSALQISHLVARRNGE